MSRLIYIRSKHNESVCTFFLNHRNYFSRLEDRVAHVYHATFTHREFCQSYHSPEYHKLPEELVSYNYNVVPVKYLKFIPILPKPRCFEELTIRTCEEDSNFLQRAHQFSCDFLPCFLRENCTNDQTCRTLYLSDRLQWQNIPEPW